MGCTTINNHLLALRALQGKYQQALAKQSVDLEQERGQSAEMRRRLVQLNANYMSTGGPPLPPPEPSKPARIPGFSGWYCSGWYCFGWYCSGWYCSGWYCSGWY
jgi:hypothetical protein